MLDRQFERLRHERLCAGLVASMLFNVNRGQDVDPMSALDFVPERRNARSGPKQIEANAETDADMIAMMDVLLRPSTKVN